MTNTFDRLNQVLWEAANGPIPDDILDQPADDNDTIATLQAENARLREALDSLTDAVTASDRFGDRALAITGPTGNLKWLIEATDEARAALEKPTP